MTPTPARACPALTPTQTPVAGLERAVEMLLAGVDLLRAELAEARTTPPPHPTPDTLGTTDPLGRP